jgi:hypothetical protein
MDLACFTSFHPKQITIEALQYSADMSIIACGLSNGAIRILDATTMGLKSFIPGDRSRSVRRIIFYKSTMITSGIHGSVSMWDISTGSELCSIDSSQGAIWDMVLHSDKLYLATETGCVVVVSLHSSDSMSIQSFWRTSSQPSAGPVRSLSLCVEGEYLFVGDASGSISRWVLSSGVCDTTFSIPPKNNLPVLIWAMVSLGDGYICTGDSSGSLSIWDGASCVLSKTRQDHQADILAMHKSPSGDLFTSGVDARIARYSTSGSLEFVSIASFIPRDITAICYNVEKKSVIVGGADGRIGIMSTTSDSKIKLERFCSSQVRTVVTSVENDQIMYSLESPYKISVFKNEIFLAEISSKSPIQAFEASGDFLVLSSTHGGIRCVKVTEEKIEEFAQFDELYAKSISISEAIVAVADTEQQIHIISRDSKKSPQLIPATEHITRVIASESTVVAITESGSILKIAKKKSTQVPIDGTWSGIVTATTVSGSHLVMMSACHNIFCVDISKSTLVWRMTVPKKMFPSIPTHVRDMVVEGDKSTLTMFGETFVVTVSLSPEFSLIESSFKFHPMVHLNGLIVGAGHAVCRRNEAKKQKPTHTLAVSLVSAKAVQNSLIEQFERKMYQA